MFNVLGFLIGGKTYNIYYFYVLLFPNIFLISLGTLVFLSFGVEVP